MFVSHSQIMGAEQEADFDRSKYTQRVLEWKGKKKKRRYVTILQLLRKYHSGSE